MGASLRRTAVVVALMSLFSASLSFAAAICLAFSPFSLSCRSSNSSLDDSYSASISRASCMSSWSTSYSFIGETIRSSSKLTLMSSPGSWTRANLMYARSCIGILSANTGKVCPSALIPMPSRTCRLASYSRSVCVHDAAKAR